MAWYDDIANTTKSNVQGLVNALRNPQEILKQGALYKNKDALAALLLHGDTAPIMAKLNEKSPANPMEAVNVASSMMPMGMFIGKSSAAFNPAKADLFAQLQAKGLSPQEAHAQTGTLVGPEGLLRQEISDKGSFLKGTGNFQDIVMKRLDALRSVNPDVTRMSVGDVMYHPEAFNAYPHLSDIEIRFMPKGINTKARADLNNNVIEVHPELSGNEAKSSMLHELQHFVQEKEGFARGGNKEEFYPELNKTKDDLLNQIHYFNNEMSNLAKNEKMTPDQKSAYDFLMNARNELVLEAQKYADPVNIMQMASDKYKTLGGEAEARLTQNRRNLTPQQQLQYYPYVNDKDLFGLDRPFESLLVRK